jgi:histidinol-phosphate aminotransferase
VFLSYPNNPSGNLFDEAAVAAIIDAAPGLVVLDEAYHPFAQATFLPRLADFRNLLVLRTVSKLGLAGLRLGYLVGRPEWIGEIDKVRSPYNVSLLTQLVAERILAHRDVLDDQAARIRADRERLCESLARLPGVKVFPSRANFVLARVPDAAAVFEGLRARGVLVKSMHGMSPQLEQCVRFTVGTPGENRILMDALAAILR